MIGTNRRMPAHDFLLVAFSVALIVLSTWPETQPRQWVQLRERDGSLRQYSLTESDPRLAQLRLSLEKWAKAGQETRLAVAQWCAELADFYSQRTEPSPAQVASPIRAVGFRIDARERAEERRAEAAKAASELRTQHDYWLERSQQARAEIAKVEEIRRSRKALEIPPPIVFGDLEPGRKPAASVMVATVIGLVVALAFSLWSWLSPTLHLRGQSDGDRGTTSAGGEIEKGDELRLMVPAAWVRVRQPAGVIARWGAMGILTIAALASVFV